jgi:hypothetical protein
LEKLITEVLTRDPEPQSKDAWTLRKAAKSLLKHNQWLCRDSITQSLAHMALTRVKHRPANET